VWHDKRVSVVLPTYNERDSIYRAIQDFLETGVVDEVLVVNNNAAPGTSEEVARTAAREIVEPKQGYGHAIQRGLREAIGDYLVVCEPDGTFLARDIHKLLAFADDFDVVYGSRTARMFIWRGANMGLFLRWGNWAVAKMMEFLFNSTNLTDVGCTMRLVSRPALQAMQPHFTIGGSAFGPEMMLISLLQGQRVIQIPVNYLPRVGESSVTGDPRKTVILGLSMIGLVWKYRLRSWRERGRWRDRAKLLQESSVRPASPDQSGRDPS
jgi:glycosyltransferase involved in cell wall biosynthesis